MENMKEEMYIAIRDIKRENEVRGLYSLSKFKAADLQMQSFQSLKENLMKTLPSLKKKS